MERPQTREARAEWLHVFCETVARRMDLQMTTEGGYPERGTLIANHQGYADIIVFAALHRCVFCSKAEIRKWPLLGWMTMMAGTVFVDRGRGGSALKAKDGMQAAADAGLPVVFFPEGTTTNGEALLPFHSGLLGQALLVDEPVTAAYVTYSLTEDNGPGVTVRDTVNYWGTINIVKHIFRFVALRGVKAHVRFAEGPISFSSDSLHRKTAALEAQAAVLALKDS